MPTGDKPNPSRPSASNRTTGEANRTQGTPSQPANAPSKDVDFGSYVSSTVRSSAELFGTPARSAPARRSRSQSAPPPEDHGEFEEAEVRGTLPVEPRERSVSQGTEPSTGRTSRRWRDLAGAESVESVPDELEPEPRGGGGGNFDLKSRVPWGFGDDGQPKWVFWGGVALALLALILLIWFLASRGDGNGDDGNTTPTSESVIDAPDMNNGDGTPPAFTPPEDVEPTATSEPVRGGDNQRPRAGEGTPEGSVGDPLAGIELGPVASQCEDRCMVRIADTGDTATWMVDAGTRPSFQAEGWIWTIASPEGIAWFEQNTETTLVSETAETLNLYMAWVPGEESDSDRVGSIGTVLDSAGPYRLFAADSVPPNVRPLTDWGYTVEKVAPAPPSEIAAAEEPTDIQTVEVGSLMDEVSTGNLETSMNDLIGMGSSDGSGVGTRYYTSAANTAAAEYLFSRLESYGLTVWYEDFLTWEGYLVMNVIGEVPGSDDSAFYGVMAHFDSISSDLTVAPGADDNSTGVAASLEIARVLAQYDLVHPVRVIFVNVEEVGIVGSQEFARNAVENGIPYKGVFNLDSIGAQRQYSYVVVNGDSTTTWMTDLFKQMNEAYGLNQTINAMTNDSIVADDNRLRENGIDSIMIGRELYGQSPYHHTPEDLFPTLSMLGVERLTQLTLISLAYLAQGQ